MQEVETKMFTEATMDYLVFLEGRWVGDAPDGTRFYEAYERVNERTYRSRRYNTPAFDAETDGSTVEYKDGQIFSIWGPYTWTASVIQAGFAAFDPLEAPSSFS